MSATGKVPLPNPTQEPSVLKSMKLRAAAVLVAGSAVFGAYAADITGAGATFIYPLLSKWSADYSQQTGTKIN